MNTAPDVSVIMAAWHAADFIAPAIASVLAQEDATLELIVVDDASSDGTTEAARAAGDGDPRLRVERLARNGGPSAARNRAIQLASGRYVAVVDCDDSLEPGRLARLVAFADASGADIIADNMSRVGALGATGGEGEPFLCEEALCEPLDIALADYLDPATELCFGENLGYLKPLFRRETLARTGICYDTKLRNSEDFYLVASLLAEGATMRLHPSRGYNYFVRPGSISHRLNPELTAAILQADDAFVEKYGGSLDAAARLAQSRRTASLRKTHSFERVIDALKTRRPQGVLSALFDHPGAMPHVASRLAGIAATKLRRSATA